MALVFGARGLSAIWLQSYWLAPRNSAPRHFEGAQAVLLGLGEIGLAAAIVGAWLWFSRGRRHAGAALAGLGALAAGGGFAAGLFG